MDYKTFADAAELLLVDVAKYGADARVLFVASSHSKADALASAFLALSRERGYPATSFRRRDLIEINGAEIHLARIKNLADAQRYAGRWLTSLVIADSPTIQALQFLRMLRRNFRAHEYVPFPEMHLVDIGPAVGS